MRANQNGSKIGQSFFGFTENRSDIGENTVAETREGGKFSVKIFFGGFQRGVFCEGGKSQ